MELEPLGTLAGPTGADADVTNSAERSKLAHGLTQRSAAVSETIMMQSLPWPVSSGISSVLL